ncbi:MAG TPA: DNA topoisomerase IB [Caulobacteraceae bacterium]|nr:DNA topoisomerase IB [Caulobacteraceae bacterium]
MASGTVEIGVLTAKSAGLTYVDDQDRGIHRESSPQGVRYLDDDGRPVRDPATLERIAALVIPPAWTEVWICPDPRGHIQAVGRDARGRKQYKYHADWRAVRDTDKYARMADFGRALPRLRDRVDADLARPGLPREKVLAAAVRLLEITLIRVGNDEYAKANKTFGLTTLRKRHVSLSGAGAVFEFRGKSGKQHKTGFRDRRLARVLRRVQDLPGQRLFKYVDEAGVRHNVESSDVNDYLREALGEEFSAKDFRTWAATLSAARGLCLLSDEEGHTPTRKAITTCVKAVAGLLGNTPTVCRASYIHPWIFEAYTEGRLPPELARDTDAAEQALLGLLEPASALAA